MSGKTLRSLAKDHASGVLDKDAYRNARDLLFDGVLSGEIIVKPIDFRPPVDIQDLDATMERERTQIKNVPPQKQAPASVQTQLQSPPPNHVSASDTPRAEHDTERVSGLPITLILGITIVIIIGLIILLALPRIFEVTGTVNAGNSDNTKVAESSESVTGSGQTAHATAGEELIADFLAQNDWSDNKLQEFKDAWNSLTAEEQADGLTSPLKGQLTNAIYQQLLEERALLGLGDTETVLARQYSLVNFASDLGINDSRLQVQQEQ